MTNKGELHEDEEETLREEEEENLLSNAGTVTPGGTFRETAKNHQERLFTINT